VGGLEEVYSELLKELAWILNLFSADREEFVKRVIELSDNEVSRFNLLAFDPSTPDTYILEVDSARLWAVFSKHRWSRGWSSSRNARLLLLGLNDNGTVYAHVLPHGVRVSPTLFGYSVDYFQLEELEDGSIGLPYGVAVRIQGDLVVTRLRPVALSRRSVEIPVNCDRIDEGIEELSRSVKLTPRQRASLKLSAMHRCRKGFSPSFAVERYSVKELTDTEGEPSMYRVSLSWIGGAKHFVEYYGWRPEVNEFARVVRITVAGDKVAFSHPVHRPVVLRVRPGDVLELRLIEQRAEVADLLVDPLRNANEDFGYSREVARLVISRFGELKLLYYSAFLGVNGALEKLVGYAMRSALRYAVSDGVVEALRRYVEAYRSEALRRLSELPDFVKRDEDLAAYSMWVVLGVLDHYGVFEEAGEAAKWGYRAVKSSYSELGELRLNPRKPKRSLEAAKKFIDRCRTKGYGWHLLCDDYSCPYVCAENLFCVNISYA